MDRKLTKPEKSWIMYDIGNSAFILMVSTLIPIYFNYLCGKSGLTEVTYLAYWGYASSAATLLVAIGGPAIGTLADTKNLKKPIFAATLAIGVLSCVTLGFYSSWFLFLLFYIVTKTGYSASLIFYDSMLPDVTTPERMDKVSAKGFGWGYIGSCLPFIISLIIVLKADAFGLSFQQAMMISFVMVGIWWLLFTLPLIRNYRQLHYIECEKGAVKMSFLRLGKTIRNMAKERKVFLFLAAYFFYIDGVYTVIEMATAYGQTLGLDTTGLLLALLVTQVVAFPSSLIFGKLSERIQVHKLILVCIAAYMGIAVFALFMTSQLHFWILAICVGMFQGGIQSLSRSYFAKIIPAEKSGEYFGIMDICGKGASFLGTFLVGMVSQITGSANLGVAVLAVMFAIGMVVFRISLGKEKSCGIVGNCGRKDIGTIK